MGQNQSKYWYTCQGIYNTLIKVKHYQTSHVQVKMSRPFLTGKSIVLYCWGWSKRQLKTSQKCPCVYIWVNSQNRQLTDFDHCSYLPLKCSYSRRVKKAIITILPYPNWDCSAPFMYTCKINNSRGQCISQDLKKGCPNLLFFEKLGVQMFNFQYIYMHFTNKIWCPFRKQGVQKTPKGIAG